MSPDEVAFELELLIGLKRQPGGSRLSIAEWRKILSVLPIRNRRAVVLWVFYDMDQNQIADRIRPLLTPEKELTRSRIQQIISVGIDTLEHRGVSSKLESRIIYGKDEIK